MRVLLLIFCGLAILSCTWGSQEDVHSLVKRAVEEATNKYDQLPDARHRNGTGTTQKSHKSTPETIQMDINYAIHHDAVETLKERHNFTHEDAHRHVRQATGNFAACTVPITVRTCATNSRYRTFDGTCNHPNNKDWGAAMTRQRRLLEPTYCNGDELRGCGRSRPSFLPNARNVSNDLHSNLFNLLFPTYTNMVHQFGQFLDHDLDLTPEAGRTCCPGTNDFSCWPITDFTGVLGRRCIDFTRSTPCLSGGVRQQTNMNTAFIDGSQIYGSSKTRADSLRAFSNGLLATNGGRILVLPSPTSRRVTGVQGNFVAGDDRINEMPGLATLHNLWLLEHNRIASILQTRRRELNYPNATDEQLFHETRLIVGAEMQAIVYNEYLPTILGKDTMDNYNLWLPQDARSCTQQDLNVDPSITNEFSTAAYRFGHTLVSNQVRLLNPNGRGQVGFFSIGDHYFQSRTLDKDNGRGFQEILTGLAEDNCQYYDPYVVPGLTDELFKAQGAAFGGDLIARNIQRGRDHGLPSYNSYRAAFGLPNVTRTSRPSDIPAEGYSRLMNTYKNIPENIDLFSGALHEERQPGSASGRTFQHIKGDQFNKLKFGDRYFFTQCGLFTTAQRNVFLNRRLSDVICENTRNDRPKEREYVFIKNSELISCFDSSRTLNLEPFVGFPLFDTPRN